MSCTNPSTEKEVSKEEKPVPKEEVTLSRKSIEAAKKLLTLDINRTNSDATSKHSPEVRQKKLQQAKEDFLKSSPMSAPPEIDVEKLSFPARNRLSQISFDSESSYDTGLPGKFLLFGTKPAHEANNSCFRFFNKIRICWYDQRRSRNLSTN